MTKVLILYYSTYGHIETMAYAMAEGVREGGAEAVVKRVSETVPAEIARKAHFKLDQPAPVATVEELADYDALILGVPTRYGRMASQHGGQETTLFAGITNLLHFGMVIVGLPYSFQGQSTLEEITGGSPYGATTIAGGQGQRQPSANELAGARFQGRLVAETARKLRG